MDTLGSGFIRDYMMYAAVLGFFSFIWFGWAQENPPKKWRKYIGVASGISLIVCIIGTYLSVKNWNAPSALVEKKALSNYLIVFYSEFVIAALGVFSLILMKKKDLIAPWVALIVGTHFFWLVPIFEDNSLYILAVFIIIIALITPVLSKRLNVANSAVTGIGSGTILACFAVLGLVRFITS